MRKRALLLFFAVLMFQVATMAQTAVLKGSINNAVPDDYLVSGGLDATITLRSTDGSIFTAQTNSLTGGFEISGIPAARYVLSVVENAGNYKGITRIIEINRKENVLIAELEYTDEMRSNLSIPMKMPDGTIHTLQGEDNIYIEYFPDGSVHWGFAVRNDIKAKTPIVTQHGGVDVISFVQFRDQAGLNEGINVLSSWPELRVSDNEITLLDDSVKYMTFLGGIIFSR